MHAKRWITALVLMPLIFWLILQGGEFLFAAVTSIIAILTLWEYYRIVFHNQTLKVPFGFNLCGYTAGFAIMASAYLGLILPMVLILALNLIVVGFLAIVRFSKSADAPEVVLKQVFGVIYIPIFLSFVVLLRNSPLGIQWVAFFLWVVAWGDIGAYYVGSYLGRHRICPAVSPKKTIEGAIGGIAANLAFAWLFKLLFFTDMAGLTCVVFAVGVGAVGQAGDLFESLFKRAAGVKDSGGLLPGHGGFLDRLDALIFSAPVAYIFREYLLP
jgi:phosphatidate cytidylyltransferase